VRRRPGLPRVKSGRLGVLEGAASRASFESLPPVGAVGAGAPRRPRALPARRARAGSPLAWPDLAGPQSNRASAGREDAEGAERGAPHHALPCAARVTAPACPPSSGSGPLGRPRLPVPGDELAPQAGSPVVGPGSAATTGMTDVLPQPDCSLKAVCEPLERCCLDPLEEPGSKRPPNTGARLWGRVRSKLLRQKVCEGAGAGGQRGTEVCGGGAGPLGIPFWELIAPPACPWGPRTEAGVSCGLALNGLNMSNAVATHTPTFSASIPVLGKGECLAPF